MSSQKLHLQSATPAARSPILELPNEILQEIGCYLPTDGDVLHFSQSCKELWASVFAGGSGIWRDRFGKHYDIPHGRISKELKTEYMIRAIVLNADIGFKGKEDGNHYLWMEVIQSMFEEAVTLPIKSGYGSKTLERLTETLKKVGFLSLPKKPGKSSPLFYALQLCLTAFALDPEITESCLRTDYDIRTIYSIEKGALESSDSEGNGNESDESGYSEEQDVLGSEHSYDETAKSVEPFIDHKKLDLAKLLQFRSFWQRHLLNTCEYTFNESFSGLCGNNRKPKARKEDPSEERLSPSWMGYYSCIHPFPGSLQELENRQSCADGESHIIKVEPMVLDLEIRSDLFWPEACKKIVPLTGLETKRVAFDGKQGYLGGNEDNHVFGFTEDIDIAHGGFSGWKRVCFAICERVDEQTSANLASEAAGWVHVYEAVILPGGRIMLGRWVDLKEPSAKGPFIFWDI